MRYVIEMNREVNILYIVEADTPTEALRLATDGDGRGEYIWTESLVYGAPTTASMDKAEQPDNPPTEWEYNPAADTWTQLT